MFTAGDDRLNDPASCGKLRTFLFFMSFYMVTVVMITSIIVTVIIDVFTNVVRREYRYYQSVLKLIL